ncbi:hypothetical protein TNCV_1696351 [Trichonephila clavipes]|nr:hypothetical protein TNCV_1696351 [Trichonephila clavipes]
MPMHVPIGDLDWRCPGNAADTFLLEIKHVIQEGSEGYINYTRRRLAMDLELPNLGQMTETTPELVPPLPKLPYHTNGRAWN